MPACRIRAPGGDTEALLQVAAQLYQIQGRYDLALAIYLRQQQPAVFDFIQEHHLLPVLHERVAQLLSIDEERATQLLMDQYDEVPASTVVPSIQVSVGQLLCPVLQLCCPNMSVNISGAHRSMHVSSVYTACVHAGVRACACVRVCACVCVCVCVCVCAYVRLAPWCRQSSKEQQMQETAVKQRCGGTSCTTTWTSSSRRTRLQAPTTMSCRCRKPPPPPLPPLVMSPFVCTASAICPIHIYTAGRSRQDCTTKRLST